MPDTRRKEYTPDWPATRQSRLLKPLCRTLMVVTSKYRTHGAENFPEPPYIAVTNHLSYFDVPAMMAVAPYGVVGMAARKYQHSWLAPFFSMTALIWVTQFSADREALRAAQRVLEGGVAMGIAVEGTRSRDGQLAKGTDGASFLATRTGVPLVPVGIWGTEKVLKQFRPETHVNIGKPFHLPEGRARGEQLSEYTEQIMCAIAAMLPEEYHGYYAGNPLVEEMAKIVR
ncbi:MAG TPA: lysophospholipid acyltransferase family protein [Aggregatilinea sp.]|uniref:lysophospholipid acyltransferase family protein n=1 Tax=Aggregatilinea sp. TaxID=2806333 RepID=UPI002C942FF0|nr:lysophospholipid acyltransferase family protein [Aggregatilinea sp.]HML22652.1 lysophospholipid acyltransferase family protein [Aggregatilinea sp.]